MRAQNIGLELYIHEAAGRELLPSSRCLFGLAQTLTTRNVVMRMGQSSGGLSTATCVLVSTAPTLPSRAHGSYASFPGARFTSRKLLEMSGLTAWML